MLEIEQHASNNLPLGLYIELGEELRNTVLKAMYTLSEQKQKSLLTDLQITYRVYRR